MSGNSISRRLSSLEKKIIPDPQHDPSAIYLNSWVDMMKLLDLQEREPQKLQGKRIVEGPIFKRDIVPMIQNALLREKKDDESRSKIS